MLKNGLFIMVVGFVALILGLANADSYQPITLIIGIILTIAGFMMYNCAEQKSE
ncbi:hypothetical protein SAMN04488700_1553 [Carnobacterium iners]|uniref:Uncharacterized protein n=1 Tax=Carnobacterium iners TaxID=1073423 RepID=A0A1X7N836_9LACT|nr:hypothetical protein [Carnobacterium iners]SEL32741.1 hypothetical protein SAMN04488114_1531 [Carnobacterium iners]SMH33689.1 hypothetical protein SAMN04488700_1553 [Carnobacterium iners]